jgi:hypothetical protein
LDSGFLNKNHFSPRRGGAKHSIRVSSFRVFSGQIIAAWRFLTGGAFGEDGCERRVFLEGGGGIPVASQRGGKPLPHSFPLSNDGGDGGGGLAGALTGRFVEAVDFVIKEDGDLRPDGDVHPLDIYTY